MKNTGMSECDLYARALARVDKLDQAEKKTTPMPWEFAETQGMDCEWLDILGPDGDMEVASGETMPRPHVLHSSFKERVRTEKQQIVNNLEFCALTRNEITGLLHLLRALVIERRDHDRSADAALVEFAGRDELSFNDKGKEKEL